MKAIGMISGGLDSTLAACLMKRLGVEVHGVNFSTGFCLTDHQRMMASFSPEGSPRRQKRLKNEALRAGADVQFPVEIIDISSEYLPVVLNPKYGYGSAMNPCIDCRIFMLSKAREYMEAAGADFVFTGEVLGQRPMTQHSRTLDLIARKSGLGDRLLRPLSAKLLPPTLAEKEGRLRREDLLDIRGRGRKRQMELAEAWDVVDYPQPAGGCCYLTDPNFSRRLRDLLDHRPNAEIRPEDFLLLKIGRHFRLSESAKIIVGRDEGECEYLGRYFAEEMMIQPATLPGPTVLFEGTPAEADIRLAASVAALYTAPDALDGVDLTVLGHGQDRSIRAKPIEITQLESLRL